MATGMDLVEAIRAERAEPPSGIRTLALDQTHKWITHLAPGETELRWDVDPAYLNLDGAVICSWTAALADQAMFFASNTLCGDGEGTRMADLRVQCLRDITGGTVTIAAKVIDRQEDRMVVSCEFRLADGAIAALVSAVIDVVTAATPS